VPRARPDRLPVDLLDAVCDARVTEPQPVGRERVRDDDARAAANVVRVDIAGDFGVLEVRDAAPRGVVHRDAARLELRPGRAVDHDDVPARETRVQVLDGGGAHRPPPS
jgi:hypothetical protein